MRWILLLGLLCICLGIASVSHGERLLSLLLSSGPRQEVGRWVFDEGTGTATADSTGNGNNGTLTGAGMTWVSGHKNLAIDFPGTGTPRILVPDDPELDITAALTLMAWIRPDVLGTARIINKAENGVTDGYELSLASGGVAFFRINQFTSGNTYRVDALTSYPTTGAWQHIAGTFDGTDIRIYIDGSLEATVSAIGQTIAANALDLAIGAEHDGTLGLNGAIDQAHIYNIALDATAIQAVINDERPGLLVASSDTSTIATPATWGKPNQSRVWYNSSHRRWDGLIPKDDGGASGSDHYIVTDIAGTQTFTALELEDRNSARPDAFWDDTNKKLYVIGSHATTTEFWRLDYNEVTDVYSFAVGSAGAGVTVTGITHTGGDSPASLYVTPNEEVWVAVMQAAALNIQHSGDGGATWLAGVENLDSGATVGLTTWTHFTNAGTTYAGIFAGENSAVGTEVFYFWYIDEDAVSVAAANWTDDSANIPAFVGTENGDDHVSAARDSDDNSYFAVKTENGAPTDPLINLYKRTPAGTWSQFKVTDTQATPESSRPSLVIDDTTGTLMVFVADTFGGPGYRKRAPLTSLGDLAANLRETVFLETGKSFNQLSTPRQAITNVSGMVVLAENPTDTTVWYLVEP